MGELISQIIQKHGLFNSVDVKGVLLKSMIEQAWGLRSYSKHQGGKVTHTTQCSKGVLGYKFFMLQEFYWILANLLEENLWIPLHSYTTYPTHFTRMYLDSRKIFWGEISVRIDSPRISNPGV